jgi:uncharacterized membrane protein YjdF
LLVFGMHGAALVAGLYNIRHFDSVMHFVGGLVAALSIYGMLSLAQDRNYLRIDDSRVFRLLVIGLVAMVALGWEVLEYLLDTYAGTEWQLTIADTIKDQLLGVLGAGVAALRLKP